MRTFGPFPFARANQDLAILLTFRTMKFVNRHAARLAVAGKNLKRAEGTIIRGSGGAGTLVPMPPGLP
jgi:hypothetical protein